MNSSKMEHFLEKSEFYVDFFFKIPKSKIAKDWVEKIRKIEGIQLAYEIDKRILNNLENLIFE